MSEKYYSEVLFSLFIVCRYSQNILLLREQVDNTQRQVASLEGEPRQADPLREEQVRELRGQLDTLRAKMHRMETLEKSFSETKRLLEVSCFLFCFVVVSFMYRSSFISTHFKNSLCLLSCYFFFLKVPTSDSSCLIGTAL